MEVLVSGVKAVGIGKEGCDVREVGIETVIGR